MIKLELHVHSHHSFDCLSSPERIVETCRMKGYNGVAITDHNVYRVNVDVLGNEFSDMIIIPATEIGTTYGDVLAYFIENEITEKDFSKVIKIIREQGGIAVLAHPFQRGRKYPDHVIQQVDGLEAYNAHNIQNEKRVLELARNFGKPVTAGSDAHFLRDIGRGVNEVEISFEEAQDPAKLSKALLTKSKCYCTAAAPPYMPFFSQCIRFFKKIMPLKSVGK
jgi:predicted metal-dependent phosphoesterase TrpH